MTTKHKHATPLPDSFTPQSAIDLAIEDHRAQPLTDWPFVMALHKAKERCDAYPRLVEALRKVGALNQHSGVGPHCTCSQGGRESIVDALLRELGED